MASRSEPPTICTSCPTSAITTVVPVSWHKGIISRFEMSTFSSSSMSTCFASGDFSDFSAFCRPATTSSGRTWAAFSQSAATVFVISSTWMSRTRVDVSVVMVFGLLLLQQRDQLFRRVRCFLDLRGFVVGDGHFMRLLDAARAELAHDAADDVTDAVFALT